MEELVPKRFRLERIASLEAGLQVAENELPRRLAADLVVGDADAFEPWSVRTRTTSSPIVSTLRVASARPEGACVDTRWTSTSAIL